MSSRRKFWTYPDRVSVEDLVWDRALRYGMSVFETVAVRSGRPIFLEEHLGRLALASGELLGRGCWEIVEWARELLLRGCLERRTGVVRLYVTAGRGGFSGEVAQGLGLILFEEAEVTSGPGSGLKLMVWGGRREGWLRGWKTGNYWGHVEALRSARGMGFDDALVLDTQGNLVGGTHGNFFVVIDGRLVTPELGEGVRDGVVRDWVIRRFGAKQARMRLEDLVLAEEGFMTNSRVGILRVAEVENYRFGGVKWAEELSRVYRDEILEC